MILPGMVFSQGLEGYSNIDQMVDVFSPNFHIRSERASGAAYGTKGSPNVFEEFMPGVIYFAEKVKSGTDQMNYNCYTNEILISQGSETFLVNSRMVDYLEFKLDDNTTQLFRQVFLVDQKESQFLQMLYSGKSILYKRHYREFQKADYSGAYSADRRYDEYINRYDYYISLDGTDLQILKPKKKHVLRIMESQYENIENYMKKGEINLKSDVDLARLVKYYDSLSTQSQ
jgi:hypothetical protein